MRSRALVLFGCVAGWTTVLFTQEGQQAQQPAFLVQDGGTSGRMESIFLPPLAHAPFSLTLATEWSHPLPNGGSYTVTNQRRIVRDGKGRIYQERWLLVPKGGPVASKMDVLQISDPVGHTLYNCFTQRKVCDLQHYGGSTAREYKPAIGVTGPLPDGRGFYQHEDLGVGSTEGVDTHGYLETTTINPGVAGNDRPMVTTREFWYSPELGFNLRSTVEGPTSGKQVFTVRELSRAEPDPRYFQLPEGFKVVDRREGRE